MPKVIACVIARTVSTRLPLKVLRQVDDNYILIEFIIKRLQKVESIDEIYICTSSEPIDDIFEDIAIKSNVKLYRGSTDKVIERMMTVAEIEKADIVLRITGDNVFTSYEYIDEQIEALLSHHLDYVRLVDVPVGATAEVMRVASLQDCMQRIDPSVSEYLMLYMFEPAVYKCGIIKPFEEDFSKLTLTVDTPADLLRTKKILKFYQNPDTASIYLDEIISLIHQYNVTDANYDSSGSSVKYPYGKTITFKQFQDDMKRRKEGSFLIKL